MQERNNSLMSLARTHPLPCEIRYLQKAQLSQRPRDNIRVVENVAKLLKILRNYTVHTVGRKLLLVFHCNYTRSLSFIFTATFNVDQQR